ncbi:MAG TPA: hypothetical protein VEW95_09745 [Candidatus Limnocylindrales bacterium]|nr:hypothetical protein [Candidatus Limnocylindrales bacterium]
MTDRSPTPDPFEEALAASLARYAAEAGGAGDAYTIADAMLDARRKRRYRIGLAAISGVLATAVVAGIAIGALAEPPPQVGPGPSESLAPSEPAPSATATQSPSTEPTSEALPGVEAPEACGFPDGTALSYAGRSTTSALDVQEVVGDPMSDDPADIYVTWDRIDWGGWGRVRLVCAIFVEPAGFVEVTVHPKDGGRATAPPEPSLPVPSCEPVPTPNQGLGDEPYEVTVAELWEADQCGDSLSEFGNSDLVLTAYLSGGFILDPCYSREPAWLTTCANGFFLQTPESRSGDDVGIQPPLVMAVLHPEVGALEDLQDDIYPGGEPALLRVTAHFDDPAAVECRFVDPDWRGPGPSPSPDDAIDECRNTLVVTVIEPIER